MKEISKVKLYMYRRQGNKAGEHVHVVCGISLRDVFKSIEKGNKTVDPVRLSGKNKIFTC